MNRLCRLCSTQMPSPPFLLSAGAEQHLTRSPVPRSRLLGRTRTPPGSAPPELSQGLAELAFLGVNVPGMRCCSAAPLRVSPGAVAFGKRFSKMKPHDCELNPRLAVSPLAPQRSCLADWLCTRRRYSALYLPAGSAPQCDPGGPASVAAPMGLRNPGP